MKDKIALFLPSLSGGGAERMMVNLAQGFAQRGLQVDLVLVSAKGPYLPIVSPEVRVVNLNKNRVLASLPALVNYLKKEKPLAILSTLDHANIIALWAHKIAGVSSKLIVRVAANVTQVASNARNIQARIMPRLIRWFYPYSDIVIAISKGVGDDLIQNVGLPKSKVRIIYNPVISTDLFEKAQEPLEHPWFKDGEPPVILGVGRLVKQKDFSTLIRAFSYVRKVKAARLVILGEGEERAKLEALANELGLQDDVSLPGFVSNPYAYMARSSIFVLSSLYEGFGNVLVEAMAVGLPVVSTDCPSGPAEIIEAGRYGRLVPVRNPQLMAGAILSTLNENTDKVDLRNHALKFGIDHICCIYLKALKEC